MRFGRSLVVPCVGLLACAFALPSVALARKHTPKSTGPDSSLGPPVGDTGGSKDPNAPATFNLNCNIPEAEVSVDGAPIGITPMTEPFSLPAGEHSIKVAKLGFAPYLDVFKAKAGQQVKIDVELVPVSGVLHVKSTVPGARVLVDGKYVGDAPINVEMDVGPRAVQVSKGCFKDFFENVLAVAGQEVNVEAKLEDLPEGQNPCKQGPPPPPKWYQKKLTWIVGIGAVVAVAAGVTAGVVVAANQDPLAGADYNFKVGGGMGFAFGH